MCGYVGTVGALVGIAILTFAFRDDDLGPVTFILFFLVGVTLLSVAAAVAFTELACILL